MLAYRGVTFTGLMESLGEALDRGEDWVPDSAVRRAREIDRARYSRRDIG